MYRWVDHTSELELEVVARTEQETFAGAMRALGELLGDASDGERRLEAVRVEAPDRPALLAAWLEELVFLAEVKSFYPLALSDFELGERNLTTTVEGVVAELSSPVKAVTYHRLAFEPSDDGWRARVVFDV